MSIPTSYFQKFSPAMHMPDIGLNRRLSYFIFSQTTIDMVALAEMVHVTTGISEISETTTETAGIEMGQGALTRIGMEVVALAAVVVSGPDPNVTIKTEAHPH